MVGGGRFLGCRQLVIVIAVPQFDDCRISLRLTNDG
jgi:hypothetical protein